MRCAVVGGGAWGTALGHTLAAAGHEVLLWAREPDVVEHIERAHTNPRFLPDIVLSPGLRATGRIDEAVGAAELVLFAAPSHVLRQVIRSASQSVEDSAIVVVATKGIERGSLALMSDVAGQELPGRQVVALSGPSFAMEVALGQPTAIVAASVREEAALAVQRSLRTTGLRLYTNDDVIGVELGGSLKNVMAIATGIAEGLGLGLNARAALITRGLTEMSRLGIALGARASTFAGLAGMGDLVLTCTGALSRNRAVGIELGRGQALQDVVASRESVAEGIVTARSALDLADRHGIEMPIAHAVGRILFEGYTPRDAIAELMGRELRPERDA
jgi:glycerol-3-phosphate dehydrogenase (NAD(P)+)